MKLRGYAAIVKIRHVEFCSNYMQLRLIAGMALGAIASMAAIAIAAPDAAARSRDSAGAVVVLPLKDAAHTDAQARAARDAFADGLARGGLPVVKSDAVGSRLGAARDKAASAKLAEALARLARARELYAAAKFEQAITEFEAAKAGMIEGLPAQTDGALVELLIDLGVARADLGQVEEARVAFRDARLRGGPDALSADTFSPRVVAAYRDAVASLSGKLHNTLAIATRPAGAKVFVDGRLAGTSPLLVPGTASGVHVLRAELAGRDPALREVTVEGTTDVELAIPERVPSPGQVFEASASMDALFRDALALGEATGADLVLLVGPSGAGDTAVVVVDVRRAESETARFDGADPRAAAAAGQRHAGRLMKRLEAPVESPKVRIEHHP